MPARHPGMAARARLPESPARLGRRDDLVAKRRPAGERVVGDGVGLRRECGEQALEHG